MMVREATVQPHYSQRAFSRVIVVSQVKLTGKWLLEAGFTPASKVKVHVSNGEIKIVKTNG